MLRRAVKGLLTNIYLASGAEMARFDNDAAGSRANVGLPTTPHRDSTPLKALMMTGYSISKQAFFSATAASLLALAVAMPGGAAAQGTAPDRRVANIDTVNRGVVTMITGRLDSTAAKISADLSDVLDDGSTRRLLPVVGKGARQSVTDLRLLRGIDLAILQTDIITDRDRGSMSYVMPLFSEELHIVAGEDIRSVRDLAGKRINVETPGSGTSVTVANLFQTLGIQVEVTSYPHATALEKVKSGEVAALAAIGGKPAPAFAGRTLPPGLHFLPVPLTPELAKTYTRATLTAEDYPGLIVANRPIETIAVGSVLAAANLPVDSERYRNMANLVDALFTQFEKLREPQHHPKWREVDIRAELAGWRRFGPADAWLKRNSPATTQAIANDQMKEIFLRFLDERSKAGGAQLSEERKNELFQQFQRWQQQRPR
jgi:uncharacterized protein